MHAWDAQRSTVLQPPRTTDEVHVDTAVARLAGRQDGVVSRAQLAALGVGRGAIASRVARGSLVRLHRGVYAVGHSAVGARGRMIGALLAVGPDAVLSHRSAAAAWGIVAVSSAPVEVSVPGREARSRAGVVVRTVGHGALPEATRRHGLPVTTAARTLLDVASQLPAEQLERALGDARVLRLVDDADLVAAIARAPRRHPGVAALRRAMAGTRSAATRSTLERTLLRLIRRAGLPPPRANQRWAGHVLDFVWLDERLVVETDGWAAHGQRSAFERDRARDADLVAAGFAVIRVTWRQLQDEPLAVIARIAQSLGARGP